MGSIWEEDLERPKSKTLKGDIKTDVLIIGGGMAGLLCAYRLKEAGVDCVVAEAGRICGGITKNTTAKITAQHGMIYAKLLKNLGKEGAALYFEANKQAVEEYAKLCQKIDCDFERQDSFVYTLKDREKAEKEAEALLQLNVPASFVSDLSLPFSTKGAVMMKNQGQFHPLKFAFALAGELPVLENTKVLELKPGEAVTDRGKIKAEKIIVATHFPFINKHGGYFLKLYQHRSYVLALKNAQPIEGIYVDEDEKGLSFRQHRGLLLLGGGSHKTGKKGGNYRELAAFAEKYYPNGEEVNRFATQDCMSLDGVPYIGQYAQSTPNLYVASGFNKWGMSSSMVAAGILTDEILERKNPYASVFSPQRKMLKPKLMVNGLNSAVNLLTPTAPRCPHMGCALKYNREEHSWDCPCHGSRFTEKGELIDNPATDDKKGFSSF